MMYRLGNKKGTVKLYSEVCNTLRTPIFLRLTLIKTMSHQCRKKA